MARNERLETLYGLVRRVPHGRVVSYGWLGRQLSSPVSGLVVGHWMASCPADVPWWRVVGAKGNLPVFKKGSSFAAAQEDRLRSEGVEFTDGLIEEQFFVYEL